MLIYLLKMVIFYSYVNLPEFLVGGLEHEWIVTSHILGIIPTDEVIFFRGIETTNWMINER
jgi:hypothetical protein